jgi:hypothetical protein
MGSDSRTREQGMLDRMLRVIGGERGGVGRVLVREQEQTALILSQIGERLGQLLVVWN